MKIKVLKKTTTIKKLENIIAILSSPTSFVNLFLMGAAVTSPQHVMDAQVLYALYSVHHLFFQRTNSPSLTLFLVAHSRAVYKSNKAIVHNVYTGSSWQIRPYPNLVDGREEMLECCHYMIHNIIR